MGVIETKFSIGDEINHFTGVSGMVTAIFHRSGMNCYEMTFLDDGKPACINVHECEISTKEKSGLGFKKATS